jgi:hypothetical protein
MRTYSGVELTARTRAGQVFRSKWPICCHTTPTPILHILGRVLTARSAVLLLTIPAHCRHYRRAAALALCHFGEAGSEGRDLCFDVITDSCHVHPSR